MFDVIVVGARCAGSPLAMLLARRSHKVLLVDKTRFPSDAVSTHLIWQSGLARARRWELLDRILDLGAPPIRTVRLASEQFDISGRPLPADGIDYAMAPRRTLLDKLLVDAAREAGAEVREGFYVSEILRNGERVTGIRGRRKGGAVVDEHARIVVGADGVHSLVAHATGAPKYRERPSPGGAYYSYWRGGPAVSDFETHVGPGYGAALLPTNDGLTCVVAGFNHAFCQPGRSPGECYRLVMERTPRLSEILSRGRQAEPLAGMREFPAFLRKPWGDGWALAGDAGYHKHPLSAQGISDAFRDADLLADALDAGLGGRRDLAGCLEEFERKRDQAVIPMYESTCDRALMEPFPAHMMALFRALERNRPEADRFFSTDAGTVPIAEFFAPENLERIVSSTPAARAGGTTLE